MGGRANSQACTDGEWEVQLAWAEIFVKMILNASSGLNVHRSTLICLRITVQCQRSAWAVTLLPERVIVGFQNGDVSHKQNNIWGSIFRFFLERKNEKSLELPEMVRQLIGARAPLSTSGFVVVVILPEQLVDGFCILLVWLSWEDVECAENNEVECTPVLWGMISL